MTAGWNSAVQTRGLLLAILWALVALPAAHAQQPPPAEAPQQGPPLKVSVNRVNVGVTVMDSSGRFVSGLTRNDFRVFDNGVEQPIADFLPVEEPAQVLLLIESGPAVLFFAKNHVLAADQMLQSLAPDDRVAIVAYTKVPEPVMDFTTDKLAARQALFSMNFMQGFGELNLFSSVSTVVDWLSPVAGKKAIVLLSTGIDMSTDVHWDTLRGKLETADVRILAVSLSGDIRKPAKKRKLSADDKANLAKLNEGFAQGDQALRNLSDATGGHVYFVGNPGDFSKTYAHIAGLLRNEYSLAFAPAVLDGQLHTLRVEVKRGGVQVEHRPAYRAAVPAGAEPRQQP